MPLLASNLLGFWLAGREMNVAATGLLEVYEYESSVKGKGELCKNPRLLRFSLAASEHFFST